MTATDLSRAVWRTSARSQQNGACVEVAPTPDAVAVRDSRDQDGPVLLLPPETWQAFSQRIKRGTYDI
ncbi:DUF397 domain-containing protein [Spirillospora sp. NBC_01491]|uniref:DUF397 domain-containing protein n=1 Tax=Spirillospora sp. NBC_01491 TaxID=2976007 RepID=UPI002E364E53|nr:DUF397 domain-containing protein [Spirillospora sp. NBC_01491]